MDKFLKVPISQVTATPTESGFYELIVNAWWITADECILIYKRSNSPQCNDNKLIVDRIIENSTYTGCKVKQLERVWLPHDCSKYT